MVPAPDRPFRGRQRRRALARGEGVLQSIPNPGRQLGCERRRIRRRHRCKTRRERCQSKSLLFRQTLMLLAARNRVLKLLSLIRHCAHIDLICQLALNDSRTPRKAETGLLPCACKLHLRQCLSMSLCCYTGCCSDWQVGSHARLGGCWQDDSAHGPEEEEAEGLSTCSAAA